MYCGYIRECSHSWIIHNEVFRDKRRCLQPTHKWFQKNYIRREEEEGAGQGCGWRGGEEGEEGKGKRERERERVGARAHDKSDVPEHQ